MNARTPPTPPACDAPNLHVRLLRLFASPSYRPPVLPAVAVEILQLSQRPSVTFDEVASVLEHDPLLAAKALSLAQSAYYASRSPITSLKQATVRLGMKVVRDMVLEAAMALRVFNVPGYDAAMARLARHSTTTAYLTRALCERMAILSDYAFLCGLLHDVGIAAGLLALSDDARSSTIPFEELGTVLDDVHESASGLVTRLWGLPAEIQSVVAAHHHLWVGGRPHPMHAALIIAEELGRELDAGVATHDPSAAQAFLDTSPSGLFEEACAAIGLDHAKLKAMREEAAEIVATLETPTPASELPGSPCDR